jgi:hypothetical protein
MPRPYCVDLRVRVIGDISTGASRREAAERYGVSPSVVVLWVQRFEQTGSVAAKSSSGSTSPLEEHAGFVLGLITFGERFKDDRGWQFVSFACGHDVIVDWPQELAAALVAAA